MLNCSQYDTSRMCSYFAVIAALRRFATQMNAMPTEVFTDWRYSHALIGHNRSAVPGRVSINCIILIVTNRSRANKRQFYEFYCVSLIGNWFHFLSWWFESRLKSNIVKPSTSEHFGDQLKMFTNVKR